MLQAEELTTIDLAWGLSSPKVLRCDDNRLHVIKFTDDQWGPRGCANELVVRDLGEKLGLSVPPGGVVHLPAALVEDEPAFELANGSRVTPGNHYHCLYYEEHYPITAPKLLETATNLHELPAIIGLDHWVYNRDRADNQDNLLLVSTPQGRKVVPIDFGLSFNSDLWTLGTLEHFLESEERFNLNGECYSILMRYIRRNQLRPFDAFIERMLSITRSSLEETVSLIPHEWGVSDQEREGLVNFLSDRKAVVANMLLTLAWN